MIVRESLNRLGKKCSDRELNLKTYIKNDSANPETKTPYIDSRAKKKVDEVKNQKMLST